jgi:predicted Zn-dependent protease
MYHARVNQGLEFAKSIPPLEALAPDYPGERLIQVILGQLYAGDNQAEKARLAFARAQAIGPKTARVEAPAT